MKGIIVDTLEAGTQIKLAKDLTSSIAQYGGSSAKRKMQGTVQIVHKTYSAHIKVKIPNGGGIWTILKSDIVRVYKCKPAGPKKCKVESFNPENLMLG